MYKKILIFIFGILLVFSLASCVTESIEEVRKEAIKALGYTPEKLNIVGKYGEGYVININDGFKETHEIEIDNVSIPVYGPMSYICYLVNDKIMTLQAAYLLGYIVKEDLYSIKERYVENKSDISTDYSLVDPNEHIKRCVHKADDWKIVKQPTCKNDGNKILLCKKCNKELYSIKLYKEPHNYVDRKCVFCKESEYESIDIHKESLDNLISFLGGYKLLKTSSSYVSIFYVDQNENFNIYSKKIENIYFPYNDYQQIKVYYYENNDSEGRIVNLEEAYINGWINKNILLEVQEKVNKVSLVGKYYFDNYEKINLDNIKINSKEYYLNYVYNNQAKEEFLENCEENFTIKNYFTTGTSGRFYGMFNGYYAGLFNNYPIGFILDNKEVTTKIGEYKFKHYKYEKLVVCNNNEVFDLKEAYRLGLISKEDLKKIYSIHSVEY